MPCRGCRIPTSLLLLLLHLPLLSLQHLLLLLQLLQLLLLGPRQRLRLLGLLVLMLLPPPAGGTLGTKADDVKRKLEQKSRKIDHQQPRPSPLSGNSQRNRLHERARMSLRKLLRVGRFGHAENISKIENLTHVERDAPFRAAAGPAA